MNNFVKQALEYSTADDCIVIHENVESVNLRCVQNAINTNGFNQIGYITVASIYNEGNNRKCGILTKTCSTIEQVKECVRQSEEKAKLSAYISDNSDIDIVLTDHLTGKFKGLDLNSTSSIIDDIHDAFNYAKKFKYQVYGYIEYVVKLSIIASSKGLYREYLSHNGTVELTTKDANNQYSTWNAVPIGNSNNFNNSNIVQLIKDAHQNIEWQKKKQFDIEPGKYNVVLSSSAISDMMLYFMYSMSAMDAYEGKTVFGKGDNKLRIGEKIAPDTVSLRSDPYDVRVQCCPFVISHSINSLESIFDNGLTVDPVYWIKDGVLENLIQTRYSAKVTKCKNVTPSIDNVILDSPNGHGDTLDIIRSVKNGLFVNTLWYIRCVDPATLLLTGLTRDGVYLIENGEIIGSANNFRFNESPFYMLNRINNIGTSKLTVPREFGSNESSYRCSMPPVSIEDFNMSSVSESQ